MMELRFELDKLPDVKAEPLTDSEKRIFLAAMGRERGICEKVDAETRDMNDPEAEAVNLVRVCNNIEKKVRAALWTEPAASFPQAHENDHFAEDSKKATQLVITCDGCRFVGTYDTDFPCCGCVRREKDYYEPER